MFVVLSDVWLDQQRTFDRLEKMFDACDAQDVIPGLIVFMGDFTSTPFGLTHCDFTAYKEGFDRLADMLEDYPRLRQEVDLSSFGTGRSRIERRAPSSGITTLARRRALGKSATRALREQSGKDSLLFSRLGLLPRRFTSQNATKLFDSARRRKITRRRAAAEARRRRLQTPRRHPRATGAPLSASHHTESNLLGVRSRAVVVSSAERYIFRRSNGSTGVGQFRTGGALQSGMFRPTTGRFWCTDRRPGG